LFKEGDNVKRGKRVILEDFTSNTLTTSEERFSFFRISFRNPDSSSSFTELGPCFGVRGLNQQASFNYIRFVMPNTNHWEFASNLSRAGKSVTTSLQVACVCWMPPWQAQFQAAATT
jgi:hypothetical protein